MTFAAVGVLFFVRILLFISPRDQYNAYVKQASKGGQSGQDTLVEIFDRIESLFQRLEIYTEVPPTTKMMDAMIQIIIEVLSILGITMKEIKQGRMSEYFSTSTSPLIERCPEKYAKKLIGRTDLEDALNRLDKLTDEQAQMASAEVERATNVIDETVEGAREQVPTVDDRVASVDDEAAEVINGEQIAITEA